MSYGTYDNQSSLNQPFNPTANNGSNGLIGGVFKQAGNSVAKAITGNLPGAQDPNSQQYFQQANDSHQQLGEALKNIQGMGNSGGKGFGGGMQFGGGGKSGGTINGP
jgi:hypothetical protein